MAKRIASSTKRNSEKRGRTLLLSAAFALFLAPVVLLLADGGELLLWVTYNAETGEMELSNGAAAPAGAVPGQFYELERNSLKREKQWRSPMDFIRTFKTDEGRVVFSHERHFAALEKKTCNVCHEEKKGLGLGKEFASTVSASKEPHGKTSVGRFCAGCHDGTTRIAEVEDSGVKGSSPAIFSAHGKKEDRSCQRCHAPSDHGEDYTSYHGERAERRGSRQCVECHRGADQVTASDRARSGRYKNAQLALVRDPENEASFAMTLPNNFCIYCHNSDGEAWEHTERGEREGRRGHDDDD